MSPVQVLVYCYARNLSKSWVEKYGWKAKQGKAQYSISRFPGRSSEPEEKIFAKIIGMVDRKENKANLEISLLKILIAEGDENHLICIIKIGPL